MIYGIHWTFIFMVALISASFVAAIVQWLAAKELNVVLLLIATAWVVQFLSFRLTGNDFDKELYLVCDALIMGYICGAYSNWRHGAIISLYVALVALYFYGPPSWLVDNLDYSDPVKAANEWIATVVTYAQLILAMPWPVFQKIKGFSDHGSLREQSWR